MVELLAPFLCTHRRRRTQVQASCWNVGSCKQQGHIHHEEHHLSTWCSPQTSRHTRILGLCQSSWESHTPLGCKCRSWIFRNHDKLSLYATILAASAAELEGHTKAWMQARQHIHQDIRTQGQVYRSVRGHDTRLVCTRQIPLARSTEIGHWTFRCLGGCHRHNPGTRHAKQPGNFHSKCIVSLVSATTTGFTFSLLSQGLSVAWIRGYCAKVTVSEVAVENPIHWIKAIWFWNLGMDNIWPASRWRIRSKCPTLAQIALFVRQTLRVPEGLCLEPKEANASNMVHIMNL